MNLIHRKTENLFFRIILIMVLSTFCLMAYSQQQQVRLSGSNITLKAAFKQIEQQTKMFVDYNVQDINDTKVIANVPKANALRAVMEELLVGTNCSAVFNGNHIIISKQKAVPSNKSTKTVTGIVKDSKGEPVIGANVVERGTTNGTITDVDGKFSLTLQNFNGQLRISYIGYSEKIVPIGNTTSFVINLNEDTQNLDEVVVIGYGTAKRRDLTGAIASVKTEKMEAEAPRDITDLMRGTAAGLNVGMSTSAKGDLTPSIRGKTTLTAGSSPTIVLDGVIYYGALSDINAKDVESIDVLKDASSAAVYGSQASNGVIVITTKKGRGKADGSAFVEFNTNIGFVESAHQMSILDGVGYLKYRQDYEIENAGSTYLSKYPEMYTDPSKLQSVSKLDWYNYSQKVPVSSVTDDELTRTWLSRLQLYTPEIDNYMAGIETNWADLVLHKGLQQDYTVSVSNNTNKVSYNWSIGYVDRESVIIGDEYKNMRTHLNLNSKITNFLSVGMNANFAIRDESSQPVTWSYMYRNSPYASNNIDDPNSQYQYFVAGDAMTINPLYARKYRDKTDKYYSLNSNLYAKLTLPFGIEYQVNYTPYLQWRKYLYHQYSQSQIETNGGTSQRTHYEQYHWTVDNTLHWKKEFNHVHNIEITLLSNAEKRQTWSTTAETHNYSPSDVLGYHKIESGLVPTNSSDDTYWTGDALMGRLFYSYNNKYMITSSIRRDGFSAFGANNKRATFPSIALGWVFSSEKFMQKYSNWLNYGKLRFSVGENGNRDIGQYSALSDMTSDYITYINSANTVYTSTYLYVSSMSNKDLKWERTRSYNMGLDFSVLNDLLSGSIEVYSGTTNDLLVARSLPDATGFGSVMANLGKLQNKGLEITLNANIMKHKDFNWSASANISMNRRKIKSLYGDMEDILDENGNVIGQKEADDPGNAWFIGQDPDRIWSYKRLGVWQLGEETEAAVYGCKPGDFKYKDQNNDGVLTSDDKVFQGYKTPRARLSLRNDLAYKDFTFSCTIYSYLNYYGSFDEAANYNSGMPYRYSYYDLPRWTADNPTNDYARIASYNAGTNWVDKSFIRLDNVTLSYNVPKNFLKKISVQNMRLTMTVRNAAVWAPHWTFWDPENGSLSPRSFNLGINFAL